jgi:hypothetical protein
MPLPSSIADLSTTAGSNSPAGSESPGLIDDYLRVYASYIAQLRDLTGTIASSVTGAVRNARLSVTAASATATFTADEVAVKTALGGSCWQLTSVSKAINLSTNGVGGMDTGAAPVSGAVGVYLIYNPTLALSSTNPALLAVNASSVRAPEVYGGANMPTGYTASALVGVFQTNASSQFPILFMEDRHVITVPTSVLSTTTAAPSMSALSMAIVPLNAVAVDMTWSMSSGGSATLDFALAASSTGLSTLAPSLHLTSAALTVTGGFASPLVTVPRTTYYTFAASGGATLAVFNAGYRF